MAIPNPHENLSVINDETEASVADLVQCLLSHFSHISTERLYKLAFLSEYKYFSDFDRRLTPASYEPVLSGCYSEEVQSAVEKLASEVEDIEKYDAKVGGESIEAIRIKNTNGCGLDDAGERTVQYISEEYGEMPPDEINSLIRRLDIYQETNVGEVMDFDAYLN